MARGLGGDPVSVCCTNLDEGFDVKPLNIAIFAIGSALAGASGAFSLNVREVHGYFERSTDARSRIPFLDGSEPIHERLTDQTLECEKKRAYASAFRQLVFKPLTFVKECVRMIFLLST